MAALVKNLFYFLIPYQLRDLSQTTSRRFSDRKVARASVTSPAITLRDHILECPSAGNHRQDVLLMRDNHIQQVRPRSVQHLPNGCLQFRLPSHAGGWNITGLCKFQHVRKYLGFFCWISKISVRSIRLVESIFPLNHHTQMLVVRSNGGQFLHIHDEAAVPVNINHQSTWIADCGSYCSRQTEPHCPQSTRSQPLPRPLVLVPLSRPHLMLPDSSADDRLPLSQFVKQFDGILRGDRIAE
ncbi:hypothetical protein EJ110_NYTH28137 [Nymphaea thermarum]|nr:hypothetical protein EJ110_NYTH28137 [Nymphaea thermarum]